jgi:hypothetical protein
MHSESHIDYPVKIYLDINFLINFIAYHLKIELHNHGLIKPNKISDLIKLETNAKANNQNPPFKLSQFINLDNSNRTLWHLALLILIRINEPIYNDKINPITRKTSQKLQYAFTILPLYFNPTLDFETQKIQVIAFIKGLYDSHIPLSVIPESLQKRIKAEITDERFGVANSFEIKNMEFINFINHTESIFKSENSQKINDLVHDFYQFCLEFSQKNNFIFFKYLNEIRIHLTYVLCEPIIFQNMRELDDEVIRILAQFILISSKLQLIDLEDFNLTQDNYGTTIDDTEENILKKIEKQLQLSITQDGND